MFVYQRVSEIYVSDQGCNLHFLLEYPSGGGFKDSVRLSPRMFGEGGSNLTTNLHILQMGWRKKHQTNTLED